MTQAKTKIATAKTRKSRVPQPKTKTPRKSKTALVREMIERAGGASLDDLCKATGWQPHTVRATLSGLRKAGHVIDRAKDDVGTSVYRITATAAAK